MKAANNNIDTEGIGCGIMVLGFFIFLSVCIIKGC